MYAACRRQGSQLLALIIEALANRIPQKMSAHDSHQQERIIEEWREMGGVLVAKGNPGYPGEIWVARTNCDDQWNVWTMWEATVHDDPAGAYLKNESVHWWFGRWHAGYMVHRVSR